MKFSDFLIGIRVLNVILCWAVAYPIVAYITGFTATLSRPQEIGFVFAALLAVVLIGFITLLLNCALDEPNFTMALFSFLLSPTLIVFEPPCRYLYYKRMGRKKRLKRLYEMINNLEK